MQITSVTLENIKSYRRAVIQLTPGTTAIQGHNGAGKSTLVEAIGYALFDFLPYSPAARFIREGEKVGKVVVAFVSALDERLYEVERRCVTTGSAAWFVVDPELRQKVVEGKDDTLAFLRLHLGVQTTLPLADLFDNAIAVQQGTFTADFLQTGALRKKKFDALLQVEEYRKAAEDLRDTVSHLKDMLAAHDRAIEGLTARTADLDLWRQTRADLITQRIAINEQMTLLIADHTTTTERYTAAQQRRDAVQQLQGERDRAQAAWHMADVQRQQAQTEADRAAQAQARCDVTQADYTRHRDAQADLARAQEDARTLAALQLAYTKTEHAVGEYASAIARVTAQRQQTHAAEAEVAALTPQVARQDALESGVQQAVEAGQRHQRLRGEMQHATTEGEAAQGEIVTLDHEIAQIDALQPTAQLLPERTTRLRELQAAAATRVERQKRQSALASQVKRQYSAVQRATEELHASETLWQRSHEAATSTADLAARELTLVDLTEQIARLHAEMHQTEASMHAAENGHCPFLKEPCQNLAKRGIRNLDVFFGDQVAQLGATLHPLEAQHAALTQEVVALRQRHILAERLPEYEQRLAHARTTHSDHATELQRLMAEQEALATEERDAATLVADLAAASHAMTESTDADRLCSQLPRLQTQRTAAMQRLRQCDARLAELASDASQAHSQAATLADLTAALRALGDPHARLAVCAAEAQKLPALDRELADDTARHAAAERDLLAAQQRLAPFAGLDARIAALQATMSATKTAHDDFLRHEAEAQQLPVRRQRAAEAEADAATADTARRAATSAYDRAAEAYDPTELDHLQERLHAISDDLATKRAKSLFIDQQTQALDAQIAEAESKLHDLHAAQIARGETEATLSLLHYGRDTIKEAGPFVMRALLREISATANRIFGEIIGDRSATLTWQEDYDITLRAGAYERHFAQLSGGEQMSAALAVRLALLKTLTRATIAFFDEPTQNMDDERRANLANQIRRVTGFDQLLVISHDDTFEEGLDAVIRIHKDGGESQVESDPAAMLPAPIIPFPTRLSA